MTQSMTGKLKSTWTNYYCSNMNYYRRSIKRIKKIFHLHLYSNFILREHSFSFILYIHYMTYSNTHKRTYQYTHADLNQLLLPHPARMDIVKVHWTYPWLTHIRTGDYLIIYTASYPQHQDLILMKQDWILGLYTFIRKSKIGIMVQCCKTQQTILCKEDALFVGVITSSFSRYTT